MTDPVSAPNPPDASPSGSPPKLLDQVRQAIPLRHYSPRTEVAYVAWIRRFIVFHRKRHPRELGEPEVTAFVSSLASRGVSASTQNQALSAVLFLYAVVLGQRLGWMNEIVRAQRPARLPVVMSRDEVSSLLSRLHGPVSLMASLMYGAGLRLLECVELRVKDLNFDRGELTIRDGKGGKDRVTMLPACLKRPLADHLNRVKAQHDADLAAGRGSVALPGSLRAKYPSAPFEWAWQWVFPATRYYFDRETASGADITCTSPSSSAPSKMPRAPQVYRVQPRHTHFVIRSRPIFLKPAMTSARSRNYSDTATSAPR
jgi:integron integrase